MNIIAKAIRHNFRNGRMCRCIAYRKPCLKHTLKNKTKTRI